MFCRISPLVLPITAIFVEAKLGLHNVKHLGGGVSKISSLVCSEFEVQQYSTKLLYQ